MIMIPIFVCFYCCLVVAAFLVRVVIVAIVRALRKDGERFALFPKAWMFAACLAFLIATIQIGVSVYEMRSLYRIGEIVKVGDSKDHVEALVRPTLRASDLPETWWIVRRHCAVSIVPAKKSAWMISFDGNDRVCFSCLSKAY